MIDRGRDTAGVSPAPAIALRDSLMGLEVLDAPAQADSRPRAESLVSRESLLALAVVATVVEFLALRVITRVGEFLPGDSWRGPLLATMYLGLAALNVAAIAAALAALVVALALISGAMPARSMGAVIVTAAGLNVVASVPGVDVPVWLRATATFAALLSMAIAPSLGLATVPIRLAMATTGLALIPGLVAETGNMASSGLVHAVIEALAVGAALAAPLALSRRPGRGAIASGVIAAGVMLAVILGRPTTVSSFAMWSFSFTLGLPAPVYAFATGTLVVSLVDGLRRVETRRVALAMALVILAGIRPEATYPALLALAAGTALVGPRTTDRSGSALT